MIKVIDYQTEAEREETRMKMLVEGAILLEDQVHFDGNHLIFDVPERDLATEIDEVKARVSEIEGKSVK